MTAQRLASNRLSSSLAILAVTPPLGRFMARVFNRERTWLDPVLRPDRAADLPLDRRRRDARDALDRVRGGDAAVQRRVDAGALLMQRLQQWLPWNPQGFGAVPPDLAFNTAASFTTNTNWQAYGGESTMSYFTQMAGLAYHNFVSAATGIALAIAFIRGIAQTREGHARQLLGRPGARPRSGCCCRSASSARCCSCRRAWSRTSGRTTGAADRSADVTTGATASRNQVSEQTIAQGPVASQEIIKEFGTNGGGFFNANSAHPFENPTPLTNFFEMFCIFAISAGLDLHARRR